MTVIDGRLSHDVFDTPVTDPMLMLNSRGNVRIGGNFELTSHMTGQIACVHFANVSLFGWPLEELESFCDPTLLVDLPEGGYFIVPMKPIVNNPPFVPRIGCYWFSMVSPDTTIDLADVLETVPQPSLNQCVNRCITFDNCLAIAYDGTTCTTGTSPTASSPSVGSQLFTRVITCFESQTLEETCFN